MADGYGVLLPYIDEDGGTEGPNLISTIPDDSLSGYIEYNLASPEDYGRVCKWLCNSKKVRIKDEVKIVSKSTGNTLANYWQITDLTAKEDFVTPIQASAYEETNSIAYLEWKPNLMYQMYNASIGSRQGFGGGPPLLPYSYLWPMLLSVFLHRGEWYFRVLDLIIEDAASREYSITDEIIMYKPIRETPISTYTRTVKVEIIETFF
jgi:hypothetical protein